MTYHETETIFFSTYKKVSTRGQPRRCHVCDQKEDTEKNPHTYNPHKSRHRRNRQGIKASTGYKSLAFVGVQRGLQA